jgi:hypothetical protein
MNKRGDFLTRIAARAVGDGARVEPRLASRFEDDGGGAVVEQVAEMSAATLDGSAETWPAAVLYLVPPAPAARDEATVAPTRPAVHDAAPATTTPATAPVAAPRPAPAAPDAAAASLAKAAPPVDAPALAAPRAPDRMRVDRTPIMAGVRTPTSPPAPPRAGHAPVEPRIVMLVPRADAAPMPGLRTPANARGAASPAMPVFGMARHTAATSASPAPPVVNITIGRIDVRAPAAAPAATRPASPRAAAPQTLGDYLRGRDGAR